MTLGRAEVIAGITGELRSFGSLIRELGEEDLLTPTRCVGWRVADVTGHVVGLVADAASGRFEELVAPGAPEGQAAARQGRKAGDLLAELEASADPLLAVLDRAEGAAWHSPGPGGLPGTVGFSAQALWHEAYVHGDDIRDALGLSSQRGPGLRASVYHLAALLEQRSWGPATLELDGLEAIDIGDGGPPLRGDPLTFVLVATGRAHPIELGVTQSLNVYLSQP